MTTLTVDAQHAGKRLDALLHGIECPELGPLSQKKARQLCAFGAVAVDGVVAAGPARLRAGQQVTFADQHAALTLRLGLPVVFADDAALVLHKPPGLAVHTGPLVDQSVADLLQRELPGAGLAHRLDRDASGLLLIGLTATALAALGAAMEGGEIARSYEAVVDGVMAEDRRTVDLSLTVTDEPRGDRPKTIVDPAGQRAVSHLEVLARRKDSTLVRVVLETGRTHQIRAHLAAIGHPLLGDARYGGAEANDRARATYGTRRTLLHGAELRFPQPATGRATTVTAAREPDFARLFPHPRRA